MNTLILILHFSSFKVSSFLAFIVQSHLIFVNCLIEEIFSVSTLSNFCGIYCIEGFFLLIVLFSI